MELYFALGFSVIFASASGVCAILYINTKKQLEQIQQEKLELEAKLDNEIDELEREHDALLIKKTEAETKMLSLQERLVASEGQIKQLLGDKEQLIELKNKYEREASLTKQRIESITQEMENWNKTKEQHIEITKASMLNVGSMISSKLLDDHKRETETAKKESEKIVKQTTEDLHKKFEGVFESMSALNDRVQQSGTKVDVVHRSLLNPSGAGSLGEITLENIFKNSGLIAGQDYQMQYSVTSAEGRGLRPDAVVYLPDDNVMVVDSKASKFFVELGESGISPVREKELLFGLKQSMNQHLKDLTSRNYSSAIEESAGKKLARVYMFLPTEVALDKLRKADSNFMDKAYGQGILPVGPTGLLNELLRANMNITNAKQEENAKVIIAKVRDLLNGIAILHDHASAMGKGLKSALDRYDKFSGSFNRTFMSKAKGISKLGVDVPKLKDLEPLTQYKTTANDFKPIEGEKLEEEKMKELLFDE